LYLVVDNSKSKRWILRTVARGRRCDVGLGSARLVTLADARELAAKYRKIARDGGDPLAEKRKAAAVIPTFEDAAKTAHEHRKDAWRNEKHADQWLSTLEQHVFPVFGSMRVDQVETADVLRALSPIWLAKAETARRVKQRVATVLDWAKAAGFRSGDNPAEGVTAGLQRQPDRRRHFTALPYAEVADFLTNLRASGGYEFARLAFELMILTATRTSEVLNVEWSEIDLDSAVWTIPADRMKARREHRVPLAPRSVEILRRALSIGDGSGLVFPGRGRGRPMSNMVFLMMLRRMKVEATAHGFRSAFRDWAAERTNFSREVCELALAHTIKRKTEAAYRRGDLLEKRRELMAAWEAYVTPVCAKLRPVSESVA